MKFTHLVKHNGVYYSAGEEVPIEETSGGGKSPAVNVSGKVETEKVIPSRGNKYSEEDLKLPYMKLKAMAKKEGFKVESTAKSEDIKNLLRSL